MKQDPHADWDITKDEDNTFFAHRMTGGNWNQSTKNIQRRPILFVRFGT